MAALPFGCQLATTLDPHTNTLSHAARTTGRAMRLRQRARLCSFLHFVGLPRLGTNAICKGEAGRYVIQINRTKVQHLHDTGTCKKNLEGNANRFRFSGVTVHNFMGAESSQSGESYATAMATTSTTTTTTTATTLMVMTAMMMIT